VSTAAPKPPRATEPTAVAPELPRVRLHPDDEAELRAGLEDVAAGRVLSPEESEAYLRWLETGEGPNPCESSS
jgi:predicted transcriptional regulator